MDYLNGTRKCIVCNDDSEYEFDIRNHRQTINCSNCGFLTFGLDLENLFKNRNDNFKIITSLNFYIQNIHNNKLIPLYITNNKNDDFSTEYKNIEINEIIKIFPNTVEDKKNKILLNLSTFCSEIGKFYAERDILIKYHLFFDENLSNENYWKNQNFLNFLIESGLLNISEDENKNISYSISAKGWETIEELRKKNKKFNKAFIAMWFSDKLIEERNAIKEALSDTGYLVSIIDEKEHNNYIMPEIMYEIETSDFLIADLTGNRGGVYFEAGYARGLGKEVILTVNNKEIKKHKNNAPHFDVAQMSQVRYDSPEDLKKKLIRRITATVGKIN